MIPAKDVLEDLKANLEKAFPGQLKEIVLFGSHLSGKANDASDYDFVVVWKGDLNWKLERAISDVCYETDLKYGIVTDTRLLAEKDVNSLRGRQPVFEDAFKLGLRAA